MGPQQIGLLEEYARRAPNSIYGTNETGISKLAAKGTIGFSRNGPHGSLVVDSACSASQLATGKPSGSEMIGLDKNGNTVKTILEYAKDMGKSTGLVSDTRATHATPASFAAHQTHRSKENEIADEMLNSTEVDIILSGGIRHWIPQEVNTDASIKAAVEAQTGNAVYIKSKRTDSRNLLTEATNKGYTLAYDRNSMNAANSDKILGLFAYSGMNNGIINSAEKDSSARTQPTLKEMTEKAINTLEKDNDGFFLMVEGGQIDWAGHNNDTGTMLHEMIKFDNMVDYVYNWAKDRDDTLVVLTADHETGSFGFSYTRKDLPAAQILTGDAFVASGDQYKPNFNFGPLETLDKIYAQKKDFSGIMDEAGGAVAATGTSMMNAVNNNSEFKIDMNAALEIIATEANNFQVAGHKYLDAPIFPKVDDFEEFYVYGEEIHLDLIGRKLAADQTVVWGTGTHTSPPVSVIATGPATVTAPFGKLLHHVDVGSLMIEAMTGQPLS